MVRRESRPSQRALSSCIFPPSALRKCIPGQICGDAPQSPIGHRIHTDFPLVRKFNRASVRGKKRDDRKPFVARGRGKNGMFGCYLHKPVNDVRFTTRARPPLFNIAAERRGAGSKRIGRADVSR